MEKEEIIKLVMWTMTLYGSDAGERQVPGSKLKAQAEYIADAICAYEEAANALSHNNHVIVLPRTHFHKEPS